MAIFLPTLAYNYDPEHIDQNLFAMYYPAVRCVPIICSKHVAKDGYGTATVNGKPIGSGVCVKLRVSPVPMLLLPVGEVANEFGKTYTVKLKGYKAEGGGRFCTLTFKLKTPAARTDDGAHRENEAAAKEVSDEGMVLLQNNGVLPLKEGAKVKLAGEYYNFRISAVGASLIKPRWTYTVSEALKKTGALTEAEDADTAIFFISRSSSENRDNIAAKGGYYLRDEEIAGLQNTVREHKKTVLVLNTGYPIEMERILQSGVDAIVWTGFCGQRGAESLADILCGRITPSGRLADSWPLDYYDLPSAHNFVNLEECTDKYCDEGKKFGARVYYEEKQYVGYRYFTSFDKPAAFLFGHGLSYTQFAVSGESMRDDKVLQVRCTVKNTGVLPGKNSVLVYAGVPQGGLDKPKYAFCGFAKTKLLAPGEEERLTIDVPLKDIAVFDEGRSAFILEKGRYEIFAGGSLNDTVAVGEFELTEEMVVQKSVSVCPPLEKIAGIRADGSVEERTVMVKASECIAVQAERKKQPHKELKKYAGKRITFADVRKDIGKLDDFISQFSIGELADLVVCNGSGWYPGGTGAAGKLAKNKKFGIERRFMSDGNCGVNLYRLTTGFPSSNVLAGTFNKDLAYKVGKVLAAESKEYGVAINLGPGGNLHRNILCGRHPEYFSEDPVLTGTMMGFQARGEEENGVIATYKHLFANQMEFERKSAHSVIDERTMRELYLRVFDKAFAVYKPGCVMTSYNPVNGLYPCECAPLLNDLLRGEWGFDGFVMTDWESYSTSDPIASVNAGTDLLTPGGKKYYKMVVRACKKGIIEKATLQNAAKNIVKVLIKYESLSDNKAK